MGFSVSEALEAPLAELICEAQSISSNDSTAMREILRRFEPRARRIVGRMRPRDNDRDDLLNGARWGLVQAVRKHDGRSDGFAAFASRYMRGEAFQAVERARTDDIPLAEDLFPQDVAPTAEPDLPIIPLDLLNAGQRRLVDLHYWEDKTYAAIARGEGVSLSAVRQRMLTVHRVLAHGMARAA